MGSLHDLDEKTSHDIRNGVEVGSELEQVGAERLKIIQSFSSYKQIEKKQHILLIG